MKRYILFLVAFLCIFSISCKDNNLLDGVSEDKVGFVREGEQLISAYNAQSEMIFESAVYKSGLGNGQTIVKVDVDGDVLASYNESHDTSLELLPEDCYTIENAEFQLSDDNVNTVIKVKINIKKLSEIQGTQELKYAIPLKLKSSGGVEVYDQKSGLVVIPELTGGIRPNSGVTLFNKTFEEMGLSPTDHAAGTFAITSKYLFVNARGKDLRYYDRLTGEYMADIPLSFKGNVTNFAMSNDDNDNLLIVNWKSGAGGLQTIYRITGTGAPVKYIETAHAYISGRKISITGNLDKDAIITATVENSSRVLYWLVKDGVLLSQAPQVYTADPDKATWTTNASALALGVNLDKGMYIVGTGTKSILGYLSKDGGVVAQYDLVGGGLSGFLNEALSYAEFNGVSYLAVGSQEGIATMHTTLLNVTDPMNLQLDPNSQKLLAYKGDPMSTPNNGNRTADVRLRVSDDKETMALYSFGTNGSIVAVEFDRKASEE